MPHQTSHSRLSVTYRSASEQVVSRYTTADARRAYKKLQDDIAGLDKAQIIDRLHQFNTLVPIAVLPPEILTEVFKHWMADARAWLSGSESPIGPSNMWIRISHVCHHWREVALNAPRLWNQFLCNDQDFTEEMLSRTRETLLDVKASRPAIHALRLVLQELPRLQSIELSFVDQLRWEWFDFQDLVAPHLRKFALTGSQDGEILFDKFELPRLTELSLRNTPIPWFNRIFSPTLTHLEFGNSNNLALHNNTSLDSVLRALKSMPHLQSLSLARTLPTIYVDPAAADTSRIVPFPKLRELRLEATSNICTHFLKRIHYRPDVLLDIRCIGGGPSDTDVQHLCAAIAVKLRGSGEHEPPCVVRTLRCDREQVEGWTDRLTLDEIELDHDRQPSYFDAKHKPSIRVSLWSDLHHDAAYASLEDNALVAAFCRALPFEQVQVLSNISSGPTPAADWIVMGEGMKALRELHVRRHGEVKGLAKVLAPWRDALSSRGDDSMPGDGNTPRTESHMPLFPNLETLVIEDAYMRGRAQTASQVLSDIRDALQKRRELGCPLQHLEFIRCWNMSQRDVDFLDGAADEIVWDGAEHWGQDYLYNLHE